MRPNGRIEPRRSNARCKVRDEHEELDITAGSARSIQQCRHERAADHSQQELLAIGVRARATKPAGVLTRREREIAARVAQRKANKEIAGELGVSEKRVRNSLTGIYAKAVVRSRGELVDWVRGGGLDGG